MRRTTIFIQIGGSEKIEANLQTEQLIDNLVDCCPTTDLINRIKTRLVANVSNHKHDPDKGKYHERELRNFFNLLKLEDVA